MLLFGLLDNFHIDLVVLIPSYYHLSYIDMRLKKKECLDRPKWSLMLHKDMPLLRKKRRKMVMGMLHSQRLDIQVWLVVIR